MLLKTMMTIVTWIFLLCDLVQGQNMTPPACCFEMNEGNYDAFYDLAAKTIKNYPGLSVYQKFTGIGTGCNARGVLKLTMNQDIQSQGRILIDMVFDEPMGWVFNLGDSSTNNGNGGDAGSQSRDAEFQMHNTLVGFYSKHYSNKLAFVLPFSPRVRMTVLVDDQHMVWVPDCDVKKLNYFYSPGWFALKGQRDTRGPVNYDLYLGVNRVIGSTKLIGSGLCKVGIKYVPKY